MNSFRHPAHDERALLVLFTGLEDEIERLEATKARLSQTGRSDPWLGRELRRLRRERASCLAVLLS